MLSKSSPNLHRELLGDLLIKSAEIAAKEGYKDKFRIIVNNGAEAGQSVFHLHIHVLAGRHLNWPLVDYLSFHCIKKFFIVFCKFHFFK